MGLIAKASPVGHGSLIYLSNLGLWNTMQPDREVQHLAAPEIWSGVLCGICERIRVCMCGLHRIGGV
jgi:hypothetical protein